VTFYTYIYLDEQEIPYYVGKGSGSRAFYKHCNVSVPPKDRIVVFPMDSEALAFESEKAMIELFGRKYWGTGTLLNIHAGGQQPPQRKHWSPEMKARLRQSHLGQQVPAAVRERIATTLSTVLSQQGPLRTKRLAQLGKAAIKGRQTCVDNGLGVCDPKVRAKGVHVRYHINRGIKKEGCELCR
jgi:hypothetical protein